MSVNPRPKGFPMFDPVNMSLPGSDGFGSNPIATIPATGRTSTVSFSEDPTTKIRKPYTIKKSRENWTDQEHDKFLEALHLYVYCRNLIVFSFESFEICCYELIDQLITDSIGIGRR